MFHDCAIKKAHEVVKKKKKQKTKNKKQNKAHITQRKQLACPSNRTVFPSFAITNLEQVINANKL